MNRWVCHILRSKQIGLALSGGGVRGLAHIGVIKVLAETGIQPVMIAGVSAGSIVGAGLAAGMDWREQAAMACSVFWPSLLHGGQLERFCAKHLPETFSQLTLPFAAVATAVPERRAVTITNGHLASAISASCSIPYLRRPVSREGEYLIDGGVACVMPSVTCRELGAEFVIASDVWEYSSLLRTLGCHPSHPRHSRFYPQHYRVAVHHTDLHIHPSIPLKGYVPGITAVERMITAGEDAARRALARLSDPALTSTVHPDTVPDQ
jgi:NTE family protein